MIERIRAGWTNLKERYQTLLTEYGYGALGIHIVIWLGTWFGFYVAITNGMEITGAAAGAGSIGGAYVMSQATKPIRIIITLVLTPMVVGSWRQFRGRPAVSVVAAEPESEASSTVQ